MVLVRELQRAPRVEEKEKNDMTMAEKKLISVQKEVEKLTKSLERYSGLYNKKTEKCIKLNCDWTDEEMRAHRDVDMTDTQWAAWFDRSVTQFDVEDTQERLEHSFKRLERAQEEFDKVSEKLAEAEEITAKELSWLEAIQKNEEDYYAWLREFKAECLKDGIIIETADKWSIRGLSKAGKNFSMFLNDGWTVRSLHSYTLRINGTIFFTSGLFSTGYRYLMNN